ncbi:hypothetical protein WA171_000179 [Blastocystis sp. BT1]
MSCKSCLSATGVVIINVFNAILLVVGLVMIGATGYFWSAVQKSMGTNIYIGLGTGFVTFFFPMLIVCGSYKSRCFLIFDNIVLILLTIAESVFVALYSTPSTEENIKKLLNLPESYIKYLDDHLVLVIAVAGAIVGIQFLTIIIQGIRASELKRDKMLEEPLVEDVESKKSTYREKAIEKYELGNYLNNSSQM